MSLKIERIDPCSGAFHQHVTLIGALGATRHVLWGNRVLDAGDWKRRLSAAGEVSLAFSIPPGRGTVSVVAVDRADRSNIVHFTYEPSEPYEPSQPREGPARLGTEAVADELLVAVRGAPPDLVDRLERSGDEATARLGCLMRRIQGRDGPAAADCGSSEGKPVVCDPVTHDFAW
ncbi:hypothetical protein [Streptomyces sp. NPDC023838]|uniref:hypothetical protein n=1 Tax=Streptomyces sp. NPDC023838 TaxID=3154325 RepID=UPI0033F49267